MKEILGVLDTPAVSHTIPSPPRRDTSPVRKSSRSPVRSRKYTSSPKRPLSRVNSNQSMASLEFVPRHSLVNYSSTNDLFSRMESRPPINSSTAQLIYNQHFSGLQVCIWKSLFSFY